jgi:hypothetical protein
VSPQALAAQRAFFNAALGKAAAPVAASPAAPTAAPRAAPAVAPTQTADASPPVRYARPGSRVDIKV